MAEIGYKKGATGNSVAMLIAWENLQVGDSGAGVTFSMCADRSVQVSGAFGVGGSLSIQGSNDGVNWYTLTGLTGHDLTFTTGGISMISEITQYIKPVITAGDGTTDLTVTILAKGF